MTGKNKPNKGGRPAKQGGFSIMIRDGNKPVRRSRIRAYLESVRRGLIRDLGPTEQDLTTAQLILVERIVAKLAVLRACEERIAEVGIFRSPGRAELQHALQANYLAYSNSIRLSLQALGITKRAADEALDLKDYITRHAKAGAAEGDQEGQGKAGGTGEEAGAPEIARPARSCEAEGQESDQAMDADDAGQAER